MNPIPASELVLSSEGSIYHLNLYPEDIASTIITVGDPGRVEAVSKYFDRIELKKKKREFVTHTGYVGNKRLTVISTGIGPDNIDIVLNELDALANIDLQSRTIKPQHTSLQFIRIGTSGALQPEIPVNSFVSSVFGLGFDNLLAYYRYKPNEQEQEVSRLLPTFSNGVVPYVAQGSNKLLNTLDSNTLRGITATCPGFYGPQGRQLRLQPAISDLLDQLQQYKHPQYQCSNFEMETSALYGLARLLGHEAMSVSLILANRPKGLFTDDPYGNMDKMIVYLLEQLTATD